MFSAKSKDTRNNMFSSASRTTGVRSCKSTINYFHDNNYTMYGLVSYGRLTVKEIANLTRQALISLQNMHIITSPIKYRIHRHMNQKMTQQTHSIEDIRFHRIMDQVETPPPA